MRRVIKIHLFPLFLFFLLIFAHPIQTLKGKIPFENINSFPIKRNHLEISELLKDTDPLL